MRENQILNPQKQTDFLSLAQAVHQTFEIVLNEVALRVCLGSPSTQILLKRLTPLRLEQLLYALAINAALSAVHSDFRHLFLQRKRGGLKVAPGYLGGIDSNCIRSSTHYLRL